MRFSFALTVGCVAGLFGLTSASSNDLTPSLSFGIRDNQINQPTFLNRDQNTLNTALSIRGGEVLQPTTLAEVQSILLKASAEGKLTVIDFTATWCGPCQMIAPIYKELSTLMPNVVFLKVDVDENAETAAYYKVSSMPTFLFIKKSELIDKLIGANPQSLQTLLNEHA